MTKMFTFNTEKEQNQNTILTGNCDHDTCPGEKRKGENKNVPMYRCSDTYSKGENKNAPMYRCSDTYSKGENKKCTHVQM